MKPDVKRHEPDRRASGLSPRWRFGPEQMAIQVEENQGYWNDTEVGGARGDEDTEEEKEHRRYQEQGECTVFSALCKAGKHHML
jgi:hypothetical protein